MCNRAIIEFGLTKLKEEDVKGKSVIEVGSYNFDGSVRPIVEALHPNSYIGVDLQVGPGVDQICDAYDLLDRFGSETFDLVVSTELLEHVRDWRKVISNFKNILKPDGVLLITTRSKGYRYHSYPFDFWRYETSDMEAIFSDFIIKVVDKDPLSPGVFIKAKKPEKFKENDLSSYKLYSIIKGKYTTTITKFDIYLFKVWHKIRQILSRILPTPIKCVIKERIFKRKRLIK